MHKPRKLARPPEDNDSFSSKSPLERRIFASHKRRIIGLRGSLGKAAIRLFAFISVLANDVERDEPLRLEGRYRSAIIRFRRIRAIRRMSVEFCDSLTLPTQQFFSGKFVKTPGVDRSASR